MQTVVWLKVPRLAIVWKRCRTDTFGSCQVDGRDADDLRRGKDGQSHSSMCSIRGHVGVCGILQVQNSDSPSQTVNRAAARILSFRDSAGCSVCSLTGLGAGQQRVKEAFVACRPAAVPGTSFF